MSENPNSPSEVPQRINRRRQLPDQLLASVLAQLDRGTDLEDVVRSVRRLRLTGDEELIGKLDSHLITRITSFARKTERFNQMLSDLKGKVDELLQPPYFLARYLGPITIPAGVYASVAEDGSHRVVAFAEGMSPEALRVGEEVLLSHGRNVLIGKPDASLSIQGETAKVARITADGRVLLGDRDAEIVVSTADEIPAESLKPGDRLIWDRSTNLALSRIEPDDALSLDHEDIDGAIPQQLGGMDSLRESVIARFIYSVLHPELASRYHVDSNSGRRLLMVGPPGTGKTTLMRIIAGRISEATEQQCRIVSVSGAELYSAYVGETERKIKEVFTRLHQFEGPGLLFFDEIDAIAKIRDGNPSAFHDERFLGTLLAELEGARRNDVAVIAATNRADVLDPALRARFAWELEMPRPNRVASRQIFAIHLPEDLPYQPNGAAAPGTRQALIEAGVSSLYDPNAGNTIASIQFRDGKRRDIAARELVSGRLIEQICGAARATAFERECRGGTSGVCVDDMRSAASKAIERLRSTLSVRNVASYVADLPQDIDVVSIEAVRARIDTVRYSREGSRM